MQKLRLIINNLLNKNVERESSPETKVKVNTQQRTCHACTLRYGFNSVSIFQSKFETRDALFQFCFNVSNFGD